MGCLIFLGISALIGFGISSCISNAAKDNGFKNDATTARAFCHTLVEEKLKSPSSADYPTPGYAQDQGSGNWSVTGSVDAQNSFGAKIRSSYSCQLHWAGSGFTGSASVS